MLTKRFSFLRSLLLSLLAILMLFVNANAQEKAYYLNPAHKLIAEFQTKRVVMLDDWDHGNALPYWTVTSTLNEWLNMIASHEKAPHHLVLVLEEGDSSIALLKSYISTGDQRALINRWLPELNGTLERLEFIAHLRAISQKVDSLDRATGESDWLTFDILGGEAVSYNSPESHAQLRWDFKKGWHYFVAIRDSVISVKIAAYLKRNPQTKALVFYGNGHLVKGNTNRRQIYLPPDSINGGYCLVHYLKEALGRDSVLSVNQVIRPGELLHGTVFDSLGDADVFVYSDKIPTGSMLPSQSIFFKLFDAVILRHEVLTPSHPLYLVFSRRVIESDIKTLKSMEPYLPGFNARRCTDLALESLHMLTGESFASVAQWETWYKTHKYNGLARIESSSFDNQLRDEYCKKYSDRRFTRDLYYLGFGPGLMTPQVVIKRSDWAAAWTRVEPHIEWQNAIGILWIGYPDERREAYQYLSRGGEIFDRPELYLQSWRSVYGAKY